ncbi:MAG: hypothetical protein HY735_07285, partial [Verrucomicrobia bacterium]|nr:hypothetical protein [Verrucomicrobiota bacterium]
DKAVCEQHLKQIYVAIQAYRREHKKLPDWLSNLVPKHLADTNTFLCPISLRRNVYLTYGITDPDLKTSYIYEFCVQQMPQVIWGGSPLRMQDWKRLQMATVGGKVPMVRCNHHGATALNMSFDGAYYESPITWERLFAEVVNPSDLSPRALMKQFRVTGEGTATVKPPPKNTLSAEEQAILMEIQRMRNPSLPPAPGVLPSSGAIPPSPPRPDAATGLRTIPSRGIATGATNDVSPRTNATDDPKEDSRLKDEIIAAATKLAEQANYSWSVTREVVPVRSIGLTGLSRPRTPSERGKTAKDGLTHVSLPGRPGLPGRTDPFASAVPACEVVIQDTKVAFKGSGAWQTLDELRQSEPDIRLLGPAIRFRNFKSPVAEVKAMAEKVRALTKADEVISGELVGEDAKQLLPPAVNVSRWNRPDGSGADISVDTPQPEVSGNMSVKFWIQDGNLVKYQYHFQRSHMSPGGQDLSTDQTTTIEIKEVGTTEVAVPEEAKQKLF